MSEISRLLFELSAGSLAVLVGMMSRRRRRDRALDGSSAGAEVETPLDAIGLQIETIQGMVEAQIEDVAEHRQRDEEACDALRRLLLEIDELAALVDPPKRGTLDEPVHLGPFDAAMGVEAVCGPEYLPNRRARVFLSTGETLDTNGSGSFSVQIVGNRGSQRLILASNAAQSSIIAAIEQFRFSTGVAALQDHVDPALVRLTSMHRGPRQFVGAGRVAGNLRNAFYDEDRANPGDRQLDFGE